MDGACRRDCNCSELVHGQPSPVVCVSFPARTMCLQVVACDQMTPPNLEELPALLAAAAYLGAPVVFDEFTDGWSHLPPMLEGKRRCGRSQQCAV
jgi:hypothetical protein